MADATSGKAETLSLPEIHVLTERIIGCAIEVHRHPGPGPLEATYESALCIELEDAGMKYLRQFAVPATYKGRVTGKRVGLLINFNSRLLKNGIKRFIL